MGNRHMAANGPFIEHIGLAEEVALVIYIFQAAQQEIGRVIRECQRVCPAVYQAKLFGKAVIGCIQSPLERENFRIRCILQLRIDELPGQVPKLNHALYPLLCRLIQLRLIHLGVFPEIDIAINERKTEVTDIGIGGNGIPFCFFLR